MGHSQAELAALLGSASRASEVLNRRRPLTLAMIRTIGDAWRISRDALTDFYVLAGATTGKRGQRKRRPVPDAA